MIYQAPASCCVCHGELLVTKMTCKKCHSTIEGNFSNSRLCSLSEEHLHFIEIFIKCRGNIKDVEKELKISYPTVRNRLDQAIIALGYQPEQTDEKRERKEEAKKEIIKALENGEIGSEQALEKLKNLK